MRLFIFSFVEASSKTNNKVRPTVDLGTYGDIFNTLLKVVSVAMDIAIYCATCKI